MQRSLVTALSRHRENPAYRQRDKSWVGKTKNVLFAVRHIEGHSDINQKPTVDCCQTTQVLSPVYSSSLLPQGLLCSSRFSINTPRIGDHGSGRKLKWIRRWLVWTLYSSLVFFTHWFTKTSGPEHVPLQKWRNSLKQPVTKDEQNGTTWGSRHRVNNHGISVRNDRWQIKCLSHFKEKRGRIGKLTKYHRFSGTFSFWVRQKWIGICSLSRGVSGQSLHTGPQDVLDWWFIVLLSCLKLDWPARNQLLFVFESAIRNWIGPNWLVEATGDKYRNHKTSYCIVLYWTLVYTDVHTLIQRRMDAFFLNQKLSQTNVSYGKLNKSETILEFRQHSISSVQLV